MYPPMIVFETMLCLLRQSDREHFRRMLAKQVYSEILTNESRNIYILFTYQTGPKHELSAKVRSPN